MLKFTDFLTESIGSSEEALTHLMHPGSAGHLEGHHGSSHAISALKDLHNNLKKGKKPKGLSIKFDGAPSFIYGRNKKGEPFIATKAAFNKNPKINKSIEDIEKNHGHAPGLVDKLSKAFTHLHKVVPHGMTVQGDIMHGGGSELTKHNGITSFQPNTIRYGLKKGSAEESHAKQSKIGVAIHTVYKNGKAQPISDRDRSRLSHHTDVQNFSTKVEKMPKLSDEDHKILSHHIGKAEELNSKLGSHGHDIIKKHGIHLETYINHHIRNGGTPSIDGFKSYLKARGEKEAEKVKTQKTKEQKIAAMKSISDHVDEHHQHYENGLKLSHHLQSATNHMAKILAKTSDLSHHIGSSNEETGPEGYVFYHKSSHGKTPLKIVDRNEFSRLNFAAGKMQAQKKKSK